MKTFILTWIATASLLSAQMVADGKGFYPVMVQVVDAKTGTPRKGVVVRLEGTTAYREEDPDPARRTKGLPDTLGKPALTNDEGVAVVFGYGGWTEVIIDGKSSATQPMTGTVIVELDGKEIHRVNLKDWAATHHYQATPCSAPWILVSCP